MVVLAMVVRTSALPMTTRQRRSPTGTLVRNIYLLGVTREAPCVKVLRDGACWQGGAMGEADDEHERGHRHDVTVGNAGHVHTQDRDHPVFSSVGRRA